MDEALGEVDSAIKSIKNTIEFLCPNEKASKDLMNETIYVHELLLALRTKIFSSF